MKKTVIILCSVTLVICLITSTFIIYKYVSSSEKTNDPPDALSQRYSSNVNVMLKRRDNWEKFIDTPPIEEEAMKMIDGSTATIPITAEIFRQFYDYSDEDLHTKNVIDHNTTHNAYENLIHGNKSIIFATEPSLEELDLAKSNNVELDVTPICREGFVFIVHKDNPVDSLTVEQIQKIYTGEITNWKDVGGPDLKIDAFQREPNSGSQTAMEQMVMKGIKMQEPIKTKIHIGMGALVDAVAEYRNDAGSIGYTYYYYINNLYKNENIKVLKVNGISPDNENLINETYPFTTSYYAVINKDEPTDSKARILRDWLLTDEGQRLIESAGYCRR